MAAHTPNWTAGVAWRGGVARGYLRLGLLLLTLPASGCSLFIYHDYGEETRPDPKSRSNARRADPISPTI
jgi:hypothetical protein